MVTRSSVILQKIEACVQQELSRPHVFLMHIIQSSYVVRATFHSYLLQGSDKLQSAAQYLIIQPLTCHSLSTHYSRILLSSSPRHGQKEDVTFISKKLACSNNLVQAILIFTHAHYISCKISICSRYVYAAICLVSQSCFVKS